MASLPVFFSLSFRSFSPPNDEKSHFRTPLSLDRISLTIDTYSNMVSFFRIGDWTMAETETFKFMGQQIREFRTTYGGKGISQEALAKALKVATNTISRWETAAYRPTVEDVKRLAEFFGRDISEFFPPHERRTASDPGLANIERKYQSLKEEDKQTLNKLLDFMYAQTIYEKRSPGRKAKK